MASGHTQPTPERIRTYASALAIWKSYKLCVPVSLDSLLHFAFEHCRHYPVFPVASRIPEHCCSTKMASFSTNKDETYTNEDLDREPESIHSRLVNPFIGKRAEEMHILVNDFMHKTGIDTIYEETIRKGAFLAQDSKAFQNPRDDDLELNDAETKALRLEDPVYGSKWNQPWKLYALVSCCSLGAAVQGCKSNLSCSWNFFCHAPEYKVIRSGGRIDLPRSQLSL